MSDLPAPFALPQYAKPTRSKVKLKMSGTSQGSASVSSPLEQPAGAQPSFTLRVPGGTEGAKSTVPNTKVAQRSPLTNATAPQTPAASTTYANQLPVAPMTAQTYSIQPIQATPRQPLPFQYPPHHYPNASYQPPVNQPVPSTSHVTTSALPHIEAQSFTKSPSPSNLHPLKGISLTTKPRGRPFKLDYRDGVRSWTVRLGQGEAAVSVADVQFLGDEEEEGSDGEIINDVAEEDEEDAEEDLAPRNGKGKAKKGRGRPKASARATAAVAKMKVTRSTKAVAPPKAATLLQDSVKILLNGSVVEGKEDCDGQWDVELRFGPNVLEVGEDGGMVWKVYLERISV